jgi:zinc protease
MKRLLALVLVFGCASAPAPKKEEARPNPEREQRAPVQPPAPPPSTPDAAFRAQPPPPAENLEFHAPVPKQLKLSNGLPVFLVERHEVPLVTISLTVRSGEDTEPPGKAGLASLALSLLEEGTPSRDAVAVARGFEDLAAHYSMHSDADASGVQVTALSETLDPVLEIFADVSLHPAFHEADIERIRVERLGQIAQALDDPQSVGQHVLARVIYGEKHPWGFPADGTVKSVKSISRKDLTAWHEAWFRPDNAAIFVAGDTDEATLMPLLEKRFGAWKAKGARKPVQNKVPKTSKRTVYIVDKPEAPQSQVWVGEVGVSSGAPDVFPVRVMNNILGGSFNSRLNGNLRTEHAYSYGAFSFFDTHREPGPFVAAAGVVSDKTPEAVAEFVKELDRMKTGEVTDDELADAKDGLKRGIPALFASGEQTAAAYARAWAHGLPADYYARYQQRIDAVTKADVAKAAR